jgi:hypothetical protein
MVYIVERYVPGLSGSDLLCGLAELTRATEAPTTDPAVRYLGSAIVAAVAVRPTNGGLR